MGRTLHRYIFLQVLGPFAGGLALFTFILLIARILKLVEMVVNRGVPAGDILLLFSYILPAFLEVTVPMALLLACLMACGRLSADSELIALGVANLGTGLFRGYPVQIDQAATAQHRSEIVNFALVRQHLVIGQ